jgi:hypothetical protein
MNLRTLKQVVDQLCATESPELDTNIDGLQVCDNEGWRFVHASVGNSHSQALDHAIRTMEGVRQRMLEGIDVGPNRPVQLDLPLTTQLEIPPLK